MRSVVALLVFWVVGLQAEERPNVLVILTDDQGWADIGYNNPGKVYTPNLDQLAAGGAKLTQHYVMPQCTPTRVALFTGRYPGRFGATGLQASNDAILPHGTLTMASFLREQGYATYLTGKWHLGSWAEHGPNHHGFDYSYGALAGAVGAYDHRYRPGSENEITWHRNHEIIPGYENGVHVTDLVTADAVRVIREEREKPFFLYLPYFAPHTPLDERGRFVDVPTQLDPERPGRWLNEDEIEWFHDPEGIIQKEKDPEKRLLLAVLYHLDDAIGKVVAALDETGQRENTVIFFSSDNGPQISWGGNAYPADLKLTDFNQPIPFRGSKTDVWEGGMRVPGFVNWPGTIPAREVGSVQHVIDWLPTIAGLIGADAEVPEGQPELDGEDFSAALLGKVNGAPDEREIYGLHKVAPDKWSLRKGDWKVVFYGKREPEAKDWKLFDLKADPAEKSNVAATNPEVVQALHARFVAQRAKDRKGRNVAERSWRIGGKRGWGKVVETQEGLEIGGGQIAPAGEGGFLRTVVKRSKTKRKVGSLTVEQSPVWQNWNPIENLGPVNLNDAPVLLTLGPGDYWMFGRYGGGRPRRGKDGKREPLRPFTPEPATLEGFEVPLLTTRFANQYDAPGGLKPRLGGYHAWQSRDMVNWVHHGPITERKSAWMTSAEFADGKAYFYYDFPNDQDPHVYVDSDLFDGLPGTNHGMAYHDPSHGSDSGIIRDLDGNFHLIIEDWSPINAQTHAWDSPLAARATSPDGVSGFVAQAPPVDERTTPTGKIGTYKHPHWVKENPERFETNVAEYQIHEPEQNAYGDWAAISIGGRYYLFCDYDPAASKTMQVGWFTSPSLEQKFEWCDSIGQGHPDPDVTFAEGQFYLATQQQTDYVSPGPWVESVEARVGVDTDNDGAVDAWGEWAEVKERYDYVPGFSKQVAKEAAVLDVSALPAGFGWQIELKLKDTTENQSKPMVESLELSFE